MKKSVFIKVLPLFVIFLYIFNGCNADLSTQTSNSVNSLNSSASMSIPYNQAAFKATHNSETGNYDPILLFGVGQKGSVIHQLDSGVRFVEYDLHSEYQLIGDKLKNVGDFQLGESLYPGYQVDTNISGNPTDILLTSWLKIIKDWSDQHPYHAPITLAYDLKEDFTTKSDDGNDYLYLLINKTIKFFGNKLFTPQNLKPDGSWPLVNEMLGRILIVLSGDIDTGRQTYAHDKTYYPHVFFSEYQKNDGNDNELEKSWFYAAQATTKVGNNLIQENLGWLQSYNWFKSTPGKIVRGWWFDDSDLYNVSAVFHINIPATDFPYETWYLDYCDELPVVMDEYSPVKLSVNCYPQTGNGVCSTINTRDVLSTSRVSISTMDSFDIKDNYGIIHAHLKFQKWVLSSGTAEIEDAMNTSTIVKNFGRGSNVAVYAAYNNESVTVQDQFSATSNPPTFIWPAGAPVYWLLVSDNIKVALGNYFIDDGAITSNVYSSAIKFPPGTYYWKVKYKDSMDTTTGHWSDVQSFTIN